MPKHPVQRAITVVRAWLLLFTAVMTWNALWANGYLLSGNMRPFPFFFAGVAALLWWARPWSFTVVIATSSVLTVGTLLRATEVLAFADKFKFNERLTGLSIWLVLSGTVAAFGILNILAISRKAAEKWIWDSEHPSL